MAGDPVSFFLFPPEIRNHIYRLLLCVPGPLHPSTKPPSSAPRKNQSRVERRASESSLSLLAVSRLIYDEALGIFYGENAFEFYFPTQLSAFLLSLGPQRLRCIRDITIYYQNNKSGGIDIVELIFPTLKQLPSLRRLHILLRHELLLKTVPRYYGKYVNHLLPHVSWC